MKYIDAEKFNAVLLDLEAIAKPSEEYLKGNGLNAVYWNAVSVALHAVRKAAELASVDVPNAEVRGDAPLYGAASLSTDGLGNGG